MFEGAATGGLGDTADLSAVGHGGEPDADISVDVPVSDDELVALSRRIDGLEAVRVVGLVGFFAADGHRVEGFPTKASWVRARLGLTEPAARSLLVRVARMAVWSTMRSLWADGALTGAQVEMVVRLIPKGLVDLYAEHDAECSPVLVGLSLADTKVVIEDWVACADAVTSADPARLEAPPVVPPSEAQWSRTLGDRAEQRANFAPGDATVIENALRVAETEDEPGEVRTAAQRRGDAWVDMARFFLDHHPSEGTRPGRQHPHILVTVDLDGLAAGVLWGAGITTAEQLGAWCALHGYGAATRAFLTHALARGSTALRTIEGRSLTPEVVNDLFGEGTTLARLLLAQGQVIDHGRSIRLATPTLRDAILARDGTCRFPGCDAPAAWADIHHIDAWADGGGTDIARLVALCGAHHGLVHRKGHGLTVEPDGTVVFTFPDRPPMLSPPPRRTRPPRLPLDHPTIDALTPHPFTPPTRTDEARPDGAPGSGGELVVSGDFIDVFEPVRASTKPTDGTTPSTGDDGTTTRPSDPDGAEPTSDHAADPTPPAVPGESTRPPRRPGQRNTPTAGASESAELTEIAEVLHEVVALLTSGALGPHDTNGEPLDDDAVHALIRHRAHQLVRAA
ncbi:HNH endonuclease signature motif containing protein [Rhabdothermincola salaria]|uniref:HNH endonuclease signature motif containing protein n=1 Tax=Rhabdothermincola salaria TaxID=2903142 RepID=UPI001E3A3A90|nr:HNH endonuclease signature motif containing protein [Rhabdothermincola salaria]MCD9623913.1 HNH endonuclease [Rhabdothermincola salaria]